MNRLLEMILNRGVNSPEGGSDAAAGSGPNDSAEGAESAAAPSPGEGEQPPAPGAEGDGETTPAGGQPTDGDKPAAPAEIAPLTTENVHIPEGLTVSEETISDLLGVMNDTESDPQARLDNLVGLGKKLVEEAEAARAQAWIDSQKVAAKEITDSPDFGGDKLPQAQATVALVLDEFGSPELKEQIDATGIGNSIELFRFLHKIGSLMAEGKPVVGAPTSAEKPPLAERMYPNQGKS